MGFCEHHDDNADLALSDCIHWDTDRHGRCSGRVWGETTSSIQCEFHHNEHLLTVPGDRVELVRWDSVTIPAGGSKDNLGLIRDAGGDVVSVDDNVTVPPGTLGTVTDVDDVQTIHVDWDNGRRLGLLPGRDQWKRLT